jgi:REP-associated tyrosine transposase
MARAARFKIEDAACWYHVNNHAVAKKGQYPLQNQATKMKLMSIFQLYAAAYCCRLATFCIMGNHYHVVLEFEAPGRLSQKELKRRATLLYPGASGEEKLNYWGDIDWIRFNQRLHNLSDFMKDIQQTFSRWYNRKHNRKGHFWAERFKSTILANPLNACLYVELNPVRAGLTNRPENFKGSACFLRSAGQASWLMQLTELTGIDDPKEAEIHYRSLLYWRGAVPTKENHARISEKIIRLEEKRGFKERGRFLKKVAWYKDGLAVGSKEQIALLLEKALDMGIYVRRKNPLKGNQQEHYLKAINKKT